MAMTDQRETLEGAVRGALRELHAVKLRRETAFVQTPVLFPSGGTVVIAISEAGKGYLVTDAGSAFEEADLAGAQATFARTAKKIAETQEIGYENDGFFIKNVDRDQLSGAIMAVASCAQFAATNAIQNQVERVQEDLSARLYKRLSRVFEPSKVAQEYQITGHSGTRWRVDVAYTGGKVPTLFEAVGPSKPGIYHVVTKFHDIGLRDDHPKRVAVIRKKADLGTLLGVLSQASNIVEEGATSDRYRKLANA